MMKLLFVLSVFLVGRSYADVVEYNISGVVHGIGEGRAITVGAHGLMIHELNSASATIIVWAANKTYTLEVLTNLQILPISGPNSSTYTIFAKSTMATNGNGKVIFDTILIKGLNRSLKIGTGKTVTFPAVLTSANNWSVFPALGADEWIFEEKETFTFSAGRTAVDNDEHLAPEQVAANMEDYLRTHGYSKVSE